MLPLNRISFSCQRTAALNDSRTPTAPFPTSWILLDPPPILRGRMRNTLPGRTSVSSFVFLDCDLRPDTVNDTVSVIQPILRPSTPPLIDCRVRVGIQEQWSPSRAYVGEFLGSMCSSRGFCDLVFPSYIYCFVAFISGSNHMSIIQDICMAIYFSNLLRKTLWLAFGYVLLLMMLIQNLTLGLPA